MFGTIGHARLKPGSRAHLDGLMADWNASIRPRIPGAIVNLIGNAAGSPGDIVFVALVQDEATYRNLAAMPEQDAWFRRFAEHVDGDVRWEDVEMESVSS
ncbi:MAG: hypothetical protein IT336_09245 [Thermomicrobiales bacterium]|nr:hypothetical protein [Thermomicrobiales bacterium]